MKKVSFCWMTFFMVSLLSVELISCSSDEEPDQTAIYAEKIQGNWELVGRRNRALSIDYIKEEHYSKVVTFSKSSNNSGTYKMFIEDSTLGNKTTDEIENSFIIDQDISSGKIILRMKFTNINGDSWTDSYIEFSDNYNTLCILKKTPTGYLDIDEKYKRK